MWAKGEAQISWNENSHYPSRIMNDCYKGSSISNKLEQSYVLPKHSYCVLARFIQATTPWLRGWSTLGFSAHQGWTLGDHSTGLIDAATPSLSIIHRFNIRPPREQLSRSDLPHWRTLLTLVLPHLHLYSQHNENLGTRAVLGLHIGATDDAYWGIRRNHVLRDDNS